MSQKTPKPGRGYRAPKALDGHDTQPGPIMVGQQNH
jgi:hypothetical protein